MRMDEYRRRRYSKTLLYVHMKEMRRYGGISSTSGEQYKPYPSSPGISANAQYQHHYTRPEADKYV